MQISNHFIYNTRNLINNKNTPTHKNNFNPDTPVNKELSNYCYKPFFTSNDIIIITNDYLKDLILTGNEIKWDRNYISHLDKQFQEYEDDGTLEDLIRATDSGNFKDYLHGNNLYAVSNDLTKETFENIYNLNYEKWLNIPKSCEIQFISEDNNKKRLKQCSDRIAYEINERLLKSPAKKYILNKLGLQPDNDKILIPKTTYQSKKNLHKFNEDIITKLDKVWKRAEKNMSSKHSDTKYLANEILTSHDDLLQIQDEIQSINTGNGKNEFNLTIKMWDRNPYRDLFQGNYSTCCIGMGRRNGDMMARYILNTCFNMIELVDNNTGNTIGNALCYFAETDNEPAFIIDNIEINNNFKPSDDVGDKLRDAITEYSSNLLKEICPDRNIKIYMGADRNDVPLPKTQPPEQKVIKFIGDIRSDIYLDVYGGHVFNTDELTKEVTLCSLS